MRVVLLTVLVACGSSDRPAPVEPTRVAVDCAGAAASAAAMADEPSREAVRATVAIRCTEDAWPAMAAECIARAQDRPDAHRCVHDELTGAQADRLMADVGAAIDRSVAPSEPVAPPDVTGEVDPEAPTVTDLYPARGELAGGTFVILRGTHFTDATRTAAVRFGTQPATLVRFASNGELVVQTPPGTGTVDVTVTFSPGGERVLPAAFTYAAARPIQAARGSQAALAAEANKRGEARLKAEDYDEAAEAFRDAAARTGEPRYFLNLCTAYFYMARYSEALVACDGVRAAEPTPEESASADALIASIKAEARRQGVVVP